MQPIIAYSIFRDNELYIKFVFNSVIYNSCVFTPNGGDFIDNDDFIRVYDPIHKTWGSGYTATFLSNKVGGDSADPLNSLNTYTDIMVHITDIRINKPQLVRFNFNVTGCEGCCLPDNYYVYCIDLTPLHNMLLNSINLDCQLNNCEIPNDLINQIIKLYTLELLANNTHDESAEDLMQAYNKIALRNIHTVNRSNCNCHG